MLINRLVFGVVVCNIYGMVWYGMVWYGQVWNVDGLNGCICRRLHDGVHVRSSACCSVCVGATCGPEGCRCLSLAVGGI